MLKMRVCFLRLHVTTIPTPEKLIVGGNAEKGGGSGRVVGRESR